ncbi:MAG: transcription elongation factor GreA [Gemmatimonadales bacterium]|nr:transcription elongation factor GreA [Gemmatimonadales bacterium]
MLREMREKLGREIQELTYELKVTLPKAIGVALEMGDLRENSEYKAALERQQFVQARLGHLSQRLSQMSLMPTSGAAKDRAGLGSMITVVDTETQEEDVYTLVLAELMDVDAGHISLASPLGQALRDRKVGEEVELRLPHTTRHLRITKLEIPEENEG